jgi:hypothetical protein
MTDQYETYVQGVQNNDAGSYDLLLSTGSPNTSAGLYLKSDTTVAQSKGTHIYQDASDNAYMDLRSTTDAAFTFRLQDHRLGNVTSALTLQADDQNSSSGFGAQVGGRLKASQLFIGSKDTRAPEQPGVYMSQSADAVATINVNKGAGTGGFVFRTYNSDGVNNMLHLSLNVDGTVTAPYYQLTNNANDVPTAIAAIDENGNLVRYYDANQRISSVNARAIAISQGESDAAKKINQIIERINGLHFFSNNIELVVPITPFTTPDPGLYVVDKSTPSAPGAFSAYAVYPNKSAFQLNSSMMLQGDALPEPYDNSKWVKIGEFQRDHFFDISYYLGASPLPALVQKAAKVVASAKLSPDGKLQLDGMSPWAGSKWHSVITVV